MAARLFVSRDTFVAAGTRRSNRRPWHHGNRGIRLNLHDRLANLAAPGSDELASVGPKRRLPQRIRRPRA